MKTLDKLMMTIVGLLCFCVSAAALIFMDFSTEHGVVYADALYCIPVCVLLLAFAVLTILKFRTGYDGNLKLAGIVWDVLFALAFLPILGVPAIAQASGALWIALQGTVRAGAADAESLDSAAETGRMSASVALRANLPAT